MKIEGDKYSYRDKQDLLKAPEVDSKQILSRHAAHIILLRRSTAVSKTNTILFLRL